MFLLARTAKTNTPSTNSNGDASVAPTSSDAILRQKIADLEEEESKIGKDHQNQRERIREAKSDSERGSARAELDKIEKAGAELALALVRARLQRLERQKGAAPGTVDGTTAAPRNEVAAAFAPHQSAPAPVLSDALFEDPPRPACKLLSHVPSFLQCPRVPPLSRVLFVISPLLAVSSPLLLFWFAVSDLPAAATDSATASASADGHEVFDATLKAVREWKKEHPDKPIPNSLLNKTRLRTYRLVAPFRLRRPQRVAEGTLC